MLRRYIATNIETTEELAAKTDAHLAHMQTVTDAKRARKQRERTPAQIEEDAPARWYDSLLKDMEFVDTYARSRAAHVVNKLITPENLNKAMERSKKVAAEREAEARS